MTIPVSAKSANGLFSGLLLGIAATIAGLTWQRAHPDHSLAQKRRDWALNRALDKARQTGNLSLQPGSRYVIFSDIHKGTRNLADAHPQCEATYHTALDHYYREDYNLIVLGDIEELWEEKIEPVLASYRSTLEKEARFHPGRYLRVVGNHDNAWKIQRLVRQHLEPIFPGITVYDALLFHHHDASIPEASGEILLLHGHQGTLDSDIFDFIGPLILPLYRDFQNLTGFGRSSPAEDACLRSIHDNQMYRWANRQGKFMLIAGHTHRPVWSSTTHLEKLIWQLYDLLDLPLERRPPDYAEQVARLSQEIEERQAKYPPCHDLVKTNPCYFNTGCCIYPDGDITGIEIDDLCIRLIKWSGQPGFQRNVLEETPLSKVFSVLSEK